MYKGIKMIPRKYLFNTKEFNDGRIEKQRQETQKTNGKMADVNKS